jgi:hypothetical protein
MSAPPPAPSAIGAPTLEQLAALVFELASQLHAERVHRIALECALEAAGVIEADAADRNASEPHVRAKAQAALDHAMEGVMRVITEDPDPRTPLRAQHTNSP